MKTQQLSSPALDVSYAIRHYYLVAALPRLVSSGGLRLHKPSRVWKLLLTAVKESEFCTNKQTMFATQLLTYNFS